MSVLYNVIRLILIIVIHVPGLQLFYSKGKVIYIILIKDASILTECLWKHF